jgi:hypothetical protein
MAEDPGDPADGRAVLQRHPVPRSAVLERRVPVLAERVQLVADELGDVQSMAAVEPLRKRHEPPQAGARLNLDDVDHRGACAPAGTAAISDGRGPR